MNTDFFSFFFLSEVWTDQRQMIIWQYVVVFIYSSVYICKYKWVKGKKRAL